VGIKDNLRVGKAMAKPDLTAHTRGTRQGNKGPIETNPGHTPDGRATAARSTGINIADHEPIDPRMPNLPPA
jgi:hypothetical protein